MDLRFLHFLGQFFLTGVGDGISRKKRRSFGETVRNVQYFELLKVKLDDTYLCRERLSIAIDDNLSHIDYMLIR